MRKILFILFVSVTLNLVFCLDVFGGGCSASSEAIVTCETSGCNSVTLRVVSTKGDCDDGNFVINVSTGVTIKKGSTTINSGSTQNIPSGNNQTTSYTLSSTNPGHYSVTVSTEDWYLYNSDQSGNNPVYDFVIKKAPTVQSLSGSGFTVSDGGTELPLEPCVAQNLGTETTNGWEICSTASGTFTAVPSSWSNSKNGHYMHYYSTNECGTATSSNLQLEVMSSSALTAANTTIDCGGTASLSAGGFTDATYKWYSDEACTREVHTGASYSPTGLTETTTYYVKASKSQVVQDGTASPTFTYRGSEDTYSVPENVYKAKLEVWGAQGGYKSASNKGGKGGYASGFVDLTDISKLYINVGGKGISTTTMSTDVTGGYNGGGKAHNGSSYYGCSGGGCTHIATMSGTLNNIGSSNKSKVLLVAGGGGGEHYKNRYAGGYGGGFVGGDGDYYGYGGTQSACGESDGSHTTSGGFGYGGAASDNYQVNGGGGGLYGGGAHRDANGGGGSGFLNTASLYGCSLIAGNASMPATSGSGTITGKTENGFARLTIYKKTIKTITSGAKAVTVTVNRPSVPVLSNAIPVTQTICAGSEITINASATATGAVSYRWNTGEEENSITTSQSGTYTVTLTSRLGSCSTTTTHSSTVSVNTPSVGTISVLDKVICPDGSTTLSVSREGGTGDLSYAWSNSLGSGVTSGSITTGGTYTVSVTATNVVGGVSCSSSLSTAQGSVTVNTPSVGTISVADKVICPDGSTTLSVSREGGTGDLSYAWSNSLGSSETSGSITTGGTYTVSVTATNVVGGVSCSSSLSTAQGSVTVNTPSVGTISVLDKVICPDGSTTLSVSREGGTGDLSYAWSNSLGSGATSGSIMTGGTYTVSVTATNVVGGVSCSSSLSTAQGSVTVNTPSVGTLSFTGNQEVCPGTPVTLEIASTSGSVGTLSFDWSAGTPTSGATSSTINVTASGEYRVDVTAERTLNGKSCQASDYRTAIISYKTPSSSDITAMGGIANGNILWTGHSTDWNGENNWMQYSTDGGGTYTLTDNPASSSNVVVGSYSTCVPSTTLNLNISPSVASIKVGSGITVSGNNAVTLSGDLVNGGTFNAPVVFNGTTELSGNGSTTLRDITINSGKSFNAGDKSLAISGNWTNNGTFSSTGTVTFAGGDVQTITGNAATTFNNVTFDNANGISISKEPTIDGTATFSRGVVTGDVTFGSSAKVSGASTSSHVDGIVKKNGAAKSTDFYFPTGSNGNLGKVVVTDGTATNVSVQYFSNPAGFSVNDLPRWWASASVSGFDHVSNVEYWKISSTDTITANFIAEANSDMHFNSGTAEEDKIPTNIQMAFYDNNRWTNVGGSASIGNNMLSITGAVIPASTTRGISGNYTTFGSKTASTVLPIELVSFTATCDGRSALVEWTTATEKNNDYFSLERSDDAVNFIEIARVAGAGNSIEPIDYSYTDYGIHGGDNYYRLVQVDYDGTRTVSEIVVANCIEPEVGEPDVLAYPNPFNDDLTVVLDNFGNRAATIEVYDMLGKLIYTNKVAAPQNSYETILNLSNLPPAAYTVRVSTTDFVVNRNVVKN